MRLFSRCAYYRGALVNQRYRSHEYCSAIYLFMMARPKDREFGTLGKIASTRDREGSVGMVFFARGGLPQGAKKRDAKDSECEGGCETRDL